MQRFRAALRALWNDPEGPLGFIEVLSSARFRFWRNGVAKRGVGLGSPQEIRRTLAWLGQASKGVIGFPQVEEMLDQIVAAYERADDENRSCVRAELVQHLQSPKDLLFPSVLRLACRIPLPEARDPLLGLLTLPMAQTARPGAIPVAANRSVKSTASRNGRNGQSHSWDYRVPIVRALVELKDPTLASVFETILQKFLPGAKSDAALFDLVRQAAIGLVLLEPDRLRNGLPADLHNDLLLLDELATRREANVRRALKAHMGSLPESVRTRISGGLSGLRSLLNGAGTGH